LGTNAMRRKHDDSADKTAELRGSRSAEALWKHLAR
jgi:hypothetical protein